MMVMESCSILQQRVVWGRMIQTSLLCLPPIYLSANSEGVFPPSPHAGPIRQAELSGGTFGRGWD